MRRFFLTKLIAFVITGAVLFGCNKQEDRVAEKQLSTIESVLGVDLLKQIETANESQHQLVLQSIEELKEEGEVVTVEQVNERIEENAVGFKSSSNLEVFITISVEKLNNYAQKYSQKLQVSLNRAGDETTKEVVLSLFEKEKAAFLNDVLEDNTLNLSEKRDIIAYTLINHGKMLTKIEILDDVRTLVSGQVVTKGWWSDFRGWLNRNRKCIAAISATITGITRSVAGDYIGGGLSVVTGAFGIAEDCF